MCFNFCMPSCEADLLKVMSISVQPTITMGPAEQMPLTVAALSQRDGNGEEIITLALEPEIIPPTPSTSAAATSSTATKRNKTTSGRGVKKSSPTEGANANEENQEDDSAEDVSEGFYPAYLFQNPPKKLKTDDLRRQALISMIEANKSLQGFFDQAKTLIGPIKSFLSVTPANSACNVNSHSTQEANQQASQHATQQDHAYTGDNV